MRMRLLPLFAMLLALGYTHEVSAQEASPQTTDLERLLAYDAAAPLHLQIVGDERRDGVIVSDITFAGVTGGPPTQAYLVRPDTGAGSFAGVLFVHWYEPTSPTSNRTQFLDEARALARRGTVSLLVSTLWSDSTWYRRRRWQDDYQSTVDQARDLRRALDVLLAQPGVDPQRIGVVGHDFGAMFGAVVAAVDPRPKAYVLIAGAARFPDWYLYSSGTGLPTGDTLAAYREALAPLDPVNTIGRAKASFFFQFGESDFYTPRDNFLAFYEAAPTPKRIATYASDHPMTAPIIGFDRMVWLTEQLGLPIPLIP